MIRSKFFIATSFPKNKKEDRTEGQKYYTTKYIINQGKILREYYENITELIR